MSFRADDAALRGQQIALRYLTERLKPEHRAAARDKIIDLLAQHGPVISQYPVWHPLTVNGGDAEEQHEQWLWTFPCRQRGWEGVDHTIWFRDAALICPSAESARDSLLKSIRTSDLIGEIISAPLYWEGAYPVLISCRDNWYREPRAMLGCAVESMMIHWRSSLISESWETMASYFLGSPHGSRSSLFVDEKTGARMKQVYDTLVRVGFYETPWQL